MPVDATAHPLLNVPIDYPYAFKHLWRTSTSSLCAHGCEKLAAALVETVRQARQVNPAAERSHACLQLSGIDHLRASGNQVQRLA